MPKSCDRRRHRLSTDKLFITVKSDNTAARANIVLNSIASLNLLRNCSGGKGMEEEIIGRFFFCSSEN